MVCLHQAKNIILLDGLLDILIGGFHSFDERGTILFNGNIHQAHLDEVHAFKHGLGVLQGNRSDNHPPFRVGFHHFFAMGPDKSFSYGGPADAQILHQLTFFKALAVLIIKLPLLNFLC